MDLGKKDPVKANYYCISPWCRDALKIKVRAGVISAASSLRSLPVIVSGPVALLGLMLRRNFSTPSITQLYARR
jgi:hypothetical protein